jgi:ADP-heptose:LPS heptosyltransferase
LPLFKEHFCENPYKLANYADFFTQKKKDDIFSHISGKENIEGKKKVRFLIRSLRPIDLFLFLPEESKSILLFRFGKIFCKKKVPCPFWYPFFAKKFLNLKNNILLLYSPQIKGKKKKNP